MLDSHAHRRGHQPQLARDGIDAWSTQLRTVRCGNCRQSDEAQEGIGVSRYFAGRFAITTAFGLGHMFEAAAGALVYSIALWVWTRRSLRGDWN
jgi:hypothetical protein